MVKFASFMEGCCARAARGHTAAPPSSAINSRRCMCCPQSEARTLPHRCRKCGMMRHSKIGCRWQRWVMSLRISNVQEWSAYPPILSVNADMPARQPSAVSGLMQCSKRLLYPTTLSAFGATTSFGASTIQNPGRSSRCKRIVIPTTFNPGKTRNIPSAISGNYSV